MSNNTWDINILVNGNRCKQYQHQGKTFIEAKAGSEYVIEIKNNYWRRILAVSAVDGLNVLDGKPASADDNGYIIDAYHSEKIKGFRFSDDEWAMFKFGYKYNGKTYAQSKQDGSEMNCGVIGLRLFYEELVPCILGGGLYGPGRYGTPCDPITPSWTTGHYTSTVNYCASNLDSGAGDNEIFGNQLRSCEPEITCRVDNASLTYSTPVQSTGLGQSVKPKGFDMGTEWGRKETSKVNTVSFSRGCLAHQLDIYYASRESLLEMGVPLTNELKVNLPQSFPGKYAEPPKGWVG